MNAPWIALPNFKFKLLRCCLLKHMLVTLINMPIKNICKHLMPHESYENVVFASSCRDQIYLERLLCPHICVGGNLHIL